MGKTMTDGLPRVWQKVHRKTGYHRDDIRKITYCVLETIKEMMESGVKEIQVHPLGSFMLKQTKPRKGFDRFRMTPIIVAAKHVPYFLFTGGIKKNIKKIPIKEDNG